MKNDLPKNAILDTFIIYLETAFFIIYGFTVNIILANTLEKSGFGFYKLSNSIFMLSAYLLSFGLEFTLNRYIPEFLKKKDRQINKLIWFAFGTRLGLFAAFLATTYLLKEQILSFFTDDYNLNEYTQYIISIIFLKLLSSLLGKGILPGIGQRRHSSYGRVLSHASNLVLILIYAGPDITIKKVLSFLILSESAAIIYFLIVLMSYREIFKFKSKDKSSFPTKKLTAFSINHTFMHSGLILQGYTCDNFCIAHFLSSSALASYGIATTLPSFFRNLSPARMLYSLLLPKLTHLYVENSDNSQLISLFHNIFNKSVILIFLLPFTLAFTHTDLMIQFIFNESYMDASIAMKILIASGFIVTICDIYYIICALLEDSKTIMMASMWGIANILGNVILIPFFGINGVALATLITSLCILLHFKITLHQKHKLALKIPIVKTLPAQGLCLLFSLISLATQSNPLTGIIIQDSLFIIAYAIVIGYLYKKLYNSEERNILSIIIRKQKPPVHA